MHRPFRQAPAHGTKGGAVMDCVTTTGPGTTALYGFRTQEPLPPGVEGGDHANLKAQTKTGGGGNGAGSFEQAHFKPAARPPGPWHGNRVCHNRSKETPRDDRVQGKRDHTLHHTSMPCRQLCKFHAHYTHSPAGTGDPCTRGSRSTPGPQQQESTHMETMQRGDASMLCGCTGRKAMAHRARRARHGGDAGRDLRHTRLVRCHQAARSQRTC